MSCGSAAAVVVLAVVCLVQGVWGAASRCDHPYHNCAGRNPCSPELCVPGKTSYQGPAIHRYITCGDAGECNLHYCPTAHNWDDELQTCVRKDTDHRCGSPTYNCGTRNPCAPELCESGVTYYQGYSTERYIECGALGECTVRQCESGKVYLDDNFGGCYLPSSECTVYPEGVFTSPDYPNRYRNKLQECYMFEAPAGHKVSIDFETFDIEQADDNLYIYDVRSSTDWSLIKRMTGTYNSDLPIVGNTRTMALVFVTDHRTRGPGFSATAQFIPA